MRPIRVVRLGLVAGVLLLGGKFLGPRLVTSPYFETARALVSLRLEAAPLRLPVPVEGVAAGRLSDSWGEPRSGNRRHQGIDIFAPRGRPVRSATRGIVTFVGDNRLGGNVVRVLGPGWETHYYAHLDRFDDVRPGNVVEAGRVLGYVGNSGNARGTPCHLHYGIYCAGRGAKNPYPLLVRATKTAEVRPKA